MLEKLLNQLERGWLEFKLQRLWLVPDLRREDREGIAERIYRMLWSPLLLVVGLAQLAIVVTVGFVEPTRFIPGFVWLAALLLARFIAKRRNALDGLSVIMAGLVVATSVAVLANSVHAPAFVSNILALAVIVPLYGPRAGVLLTLWCTACRAAWFLLRHIGWTLEILYPPSLFVYSFMIGCMVVGIGLMSIPSALLSVALRASEQRRVEVELARRAEQNADLAFQAVFNQTGALNAIVEPDGTILRLNQTGGRMLGVDVTFCIGRSVFQLPWGDAEAVERLENALHRAVGYTERLEIPLLGPSGRRTLQLAIAPVKNFDDHVRTLAIEGLDVTRLIEAERKLSNMRQLESLGKLAGGVAHDFNNMLLAMQGALESMRSSQSGQVEQSEALETLELAVLRASELTRKLLAFGRRDLFETHILDLETLISESADLLQRSLGASIELSIELGAGRSPIEGDVAAIEHALVNLMTNARDAMPQGGRVFLRTECLSVDDSWCHRQAFPISSGRVVRLCVEDQGVGMTEDVRGRAFEPFFTTKAVGEGSGLGLAAVHGTMLAHGGGVSVESQLGQGTSIHLYFPLATQRVSARVPPSGIGFSPQLRGRILVVDDEPLVLRVARRYLQKLGLEAFVASDGVAALEILNSGQQFDCVLTDIVMPRMSGTALVERIRCMQPGLPVIVMSGYPAGTEGVAQELLADCPWLRKPFGRSELAKALGPILSRGGALPADTADMT